MSPLVLPLPTCQPSTRLSSRGARAAFRFSPPQQLLSKYLLKGRINEETSPRSLSPGLLVQRGQTLPEGQRGEEGA